MMSLGRYALPLAIVVATLHGVACGDGAVDAAGPAGPDAGPADDVAHLAVVDHVAVYQGVAVTLVDDAKVVAPKAPVVPGRPALVRVHARTPPRSRTLRLVGELRIHVPGHPDVVLTDGPRTLTSAMNPADLTSTFDFDVAGDAIRPEASLSVVLRDPSGADPSTAEYPPAAPAEEGDEGAQPEVPVAPAPTAPATLPMNVGPVAPTLRVRLVPVRYKADGSNRLPPLDSAVVESYRAGLYRLYPVAKVEVTIREPFDWTLSVAPDGDGWAQLLDAVIETRSDDEAPSDVYYVGIFNPAATELEYCRKGCILGVAPPSFAVESGLRAAMVVGYPSERSHGTMAQEIAHAMGRLHAPCGRPAAVDANYPYLDAAIGTWGWDIVDRKLVDPDSRVFDFMSYCNPVWVSDYTFKALYENLVEVTEESSAAIDPMRVYQLGRDGAIQALPRAAVRSGSRERPLATETFALEDAAGRPLGTVRASHRATPEIGGGLLVSPDAIPPGARFAKRAARGAPR